MADNGYLKNYGPAPGKAAARVVLTGTVSVTADYAGAIGNWDTILETTFVSHGENVHLAACLTAYVTSGTGFAFVALVLDGAQRVRVWAKVAEDDPHPIALSDLLTDLAAGEHTITLKGGKHTGGGIDAAWRAETYGSLIAVGQ
jgi:hypothetical protein